MRNLKQLITRLFVFAVVFVSCEDLEEVKKPNFNFSVSKSAIAGEEIEFSVGNAPDFLNFYSGEFGSEYEHRDRTNIEGTVFMSFDCAQNWQNGTSLSDPGLSVQYSKDYDGSGTKEAVSTATWIDISDRFNLPIDRTYAWTESGITNITDLASDDEPVYIAFKILSEGRISEGNRQGEYRFNNFNIELAVSGKTTTLPVTDFESTIWHTINVLGENVDANLDQWVYWPDGFFRMNGTSADYTNEDWLITHSINLTAVLPDKGRPLKSYSDRLESFVHTYTEPGSYKVTLVGNNTTIYGNEEQVQEVTIVVSE